MQASAAAHDAGSRVAPFFTSSLVITSDDDLVYATTYVSARYYKYDTGAETAALVSTGTRNGNRA